MSLRRCLLISYLRRKAFPTQAVWTSVLFTRLCSFRSVTCSVPWQGRPPAVRSALHYSCRLCRHFVSAWSPLSFWSPMVGTVQVVPASCLSFSGPNTSNHFYCTDPPLLVLTCSDTESKLPWLCPQGSASRVPNSSSHLRHLQFHHDYKDLFQGRATTQGLLHLWLPPETWH